MESGKAVLAKHFLVTALRRLRASNQIEEDVEEMRAEERAQQSEAAISMLELMCSPTLRYPLIIGIVMQLSQQLSGINAVSNTPARPSIVRRMLERKIKFTGIYHLGSLLLNRLIRKSWSTRRDSKIYDHRHRRYNGSHDSDYDAADGPYG